MLIQSLDKMEEIVANNKNLIWDGWTVISLKPVENAITSKDGIFLKNRWYLQQRFELTENGWEIPSKLAG